MSSPSTVKPSGLEQVLEVSKNLAGLVSVIGEFVEPKIPILHLNPKLRDDWGVVSAILAMVVGFGAHQFAKGSRRLLLGWCFSGVIFADLMVVVWLTLNTERPEAELIARWAYIVFYVALGGAIGGFAR